jgi:inner membrane protein
MMTLSHLAISGLATAAISGSSDPIVIGIGGIAGLLPDVDVTKSPAGRVLFPISSFLEKRFPHRSCTHSILASLVVGAACYGFSYAGWLSSEHAHAIEIGYTFGYLADLVTKSGVQLFYPASLRCVVPGNRNLRLSTSSNWEYAILVIIIALLLLTLNINTRGGMASALNEVLGTPRGVQELVNKKGGSHQVVVTVEGVRTFDRSRVHSSFAVLDQKDISTFIIHPLDRPNELYQVSNKPDGSQIFAEHITAKVGQRIKTQLQTVVFTDEELRSKLIPLTQTTAQTYLSGSISLEDPEELTIASNPQQYPSIVKRGAKLELDRCPLDTLANIVGDTWGTGQLTVKTIYTFGS